MTSVFVLFGFVAFIVIMSNAAILNIAKEPVSSDSEAAASENGFSAEDVHAASRPLDKRAQTFVRFGKRAQTFIRFGRDAC
ncbi:unnamed protein product [Anisakis simplex]|uniref:Secreted protein n=1 Tax=Anisakis simplex TaxID=6269 RepID=A0A0M3JXP9_ANISI|nr:unnamed protein product [Anisakis simplex]